MATAKEQTFEKVQNDIPDKLDALCSLATVLDDKMPLESQRLVSFSELMVHKHKGAHELFKQLKKEGDCESWPIFTQRMQKEKRHSEISNLIDCILAYIRTDPETWLLVQIKLSEKNVDLACRYVTDGIREMKGNPNRREFEYQVLDHAEKLLKKMKDEHEELKMQNLESREFMMQLKSKIEEREKSITELDIQLKGYRGELAEYREGLTRANNLIGTYQQELTERDRKVAEQNNIILQAKDEMTAMFKEFKKLKTAPEGSPRPASRQTVNVNVVNLPNTDIMQNGNKKK